MDEQPDLARELRHALNPVAFAIERLGFYPDAWQARILKSTRRRMLMNCTRQAGKTTVTAILALHTAIYKPKSLILLFSKAQRQSSELLAKIQAYVATMEAPPPMAKEAATELRLKNGSRIVSLPGDGDTIRGYSAPALIIEDEAAFVSDEPLRDVSADAGDVEWPANLDVDTERQAWPFLRCVVQPQSELAA